MTTPPLPTRLLPCLLITCAAACEPTRTFVSPVAEQGPPPFIGPSIGAAAPSTDPLERPAATATSIEIDSTGIWRFEGVRNVINTVSYPGAAARLGSLALALPERHGTAGVTLAHLAPEFVRSSNEPWVLREKGWWHLNPQRPDFRPAKQGAKLLTGTGDPASHPTLDLLGKPRQTADIGAFATAR